MSLEDREVWLVQLPKHTKLEEVSVEDTHVTIGKSTYKIRQAGLDPQKCKVFKHSNGKNKLSSLQSVKIERAVTLASSASIPPVPKDAAVPKPRVKQLTGLRTRHFATGYGYNRDLEPTVSASASADSDVKMDHEDDTEKSEKKKKEKKASVDGTDSPKKASKRSSKKLK